MLVVLDPSRLDYAQAGSEGQQLRFTDPDGTELDFEIEEWQPGGTSHIWVRVPRIDAGSTTDFVWMYYDRPGAGDGQDRAGTWGTTYRAVWHMTGDFVDATANANHGSESAAASAPGRIGGARSIGGGQHSVVPDDASLDLSTAVTLSAWVRLDGTGGDRGILSKRVGCADQSNYALFIRFDDRAQFEHYDAGWRTFDRGPVLLDRWQWLAATFDTDTDEVCVFLDGAQVGASMVDRRTLLPDGQPIEIGRNGGCGGALNGSLDELRIESEARSPTWIGAQHRSMTDAYVSFGLPERIR